MLIVPLLVHLPVDCSGIDTLSWLSRHESSCQFLPVYQGTAENSCLFISGVFFYFWSEIFTFNNRKMHTFDLLIVIIMYPMAK